MKKAEVVELVGKPYKGVGNAIGFSLFLAFFAIITIAFLYIEFLKIEIYNQETFFDFISNSIEAITICITCFTILGFTWYNTLHLNKLEIYQDKMKLKSLFGKPKIIYFKDINSWYEWEDFEGGIDNIDEPQDQLYLLNKSQELLYCLRAANYENYSDLKFHLTYKKRERKTPYNRPSDFMEKPRQKWILILLGLLWIGIGICRWNFNLDGSTEGLGFILIGVFLLIYALMG